MKAKLFVHGRKKEMRLSNGETHFSREKESKQGFINRITKHVDSQFMEALTIQDFDIVKLRKRGSAQLLKNIEKASGVELELIQAILDEREVSYPKIEDVSTDEKPAAKKKEKPATEKKEKPATEKKEKPAAKKKEPKVITKEEIEATVAKATSLKGNVGKEVSFLPFRTGQRTNGIIKSVWVDKRVPMALYKIKTEAGVIKNKVVDSEDLEIGKMPKEDKK